MPIAPFLPLIGAGVNALSQLGTNALNVKAQKDINQQNLDYQTGWANQQRAWALQDWEMQNEYNTPANQRLRMMQANINPALMYGSGSTNQPSATVRSTPSPQYQGKAPEYNLSAASSISTYLGIKMQQAQVEQMEIQNDLLKEKINNTLSSTQLNWDKSLFTQRQNEQLELLLQGVYDYNASGLQENGNNHNYYAEKNIMEMKQKQQNLINSFDENQRREILNAKNVDEILSKIVLIAQQTATSEAKKREIEENILLLKKSNALKGIKLSGEEFLNSRFDNPGAKILSLILQKALDKQ